MSAINVIRQSTAVHMITDGAAYSDDGTLELMLPKVWPMPQLSAAVATRGPALSAAIICTALASCAQSYDELKANVSDVVQASMPVLATVGGQCGHGAAFEVIVAGWSASGPDSYILCSHRRHAGITPWQVVTLGPCSLAPGDPAIHHAFRGAFPSVASADELDPAVDGLRMLEIQRRATVPHGAAARRMSTVGGFAQLTTITPQTITTRVLHRWPDKLGATMQSARDSWAEAQEAVL